MILINLVVEVITTLYVCLRKTVVTLQTVTNTGLLLLSLLESISDTTVGENVRITCDNQFRHKRILSTK